MRLETLAVHAGAEADAETGAVAVPLHLSTTFKHGPAGERVAGHEYQRESNPTQDRLESCLAALEGGQRALAFGVRHGGHALPAGKPAERRARADSG
jgi:cystathionine gamma-synthase